MHTVLFMDNHQVNPYAAPQLHLSKPVESAVNKRYCMSHSPFFLKFFMFILYILYKFKKIIILHIFSSSFLLSRYSFNACPTAILHNAQYISMKLYLFIFHAILNTFCLILLINQLANMLTSGIIKFFNLLF